MRKIADLPDSAWEGLAARAAGDPDSLATLARTACSAGRFDRAYALARVAREAAPGNPEIHAATAWPLTAGVPRWHVQMLKETARAEAYAEAISRAVKPGMRVLDIGAGSGLLAMLAARAGAGHVFTCEANPAIADVATDIVARNGWAGRVTVIPKHSTSLDVDADLGGPVDLLISEVIASPLLGEGVLATVADARKRLLRPGAPMIPVRGEVRVALASWDRLGSGEIREMAGFDLSLFNRLVAEPRRLKPDDPGLMLMGPAATLFDFDFREAPADAQGRGEVMLTASGGVANGVVQWIRIRLDDQVTYENTPGTVEQSAWFYSFYPFATPRRLAPGDVVRVEGRHSSDMVWLWSEL